MIELRHSTTVIVKVGPIVNSTGITPVTNLTIDAADEAELLKHNTTGTLAISGTLTAIANCDGYYYLSLAAADVSEKGPLTLAINDDSACLPYRQTFLVVDSKYYDSKYSTTLWNVNVEAISLDTAAADTLETHVEGSTLFKVDVDAVRTMTATASNIATSHTNINSIASLLVSVSSVTTIINSNTAQTAGRIAGTLLAGNHTAQSGDGYAILNNGTYGNSALNTAIGTMQGNVNSIASLLVTVSSVTTIINSNTAQTAGRIVGTLLAGNHSPQSGDGYAIVNNGTYGNSALNTDIDAILADTNELQTDLVNGGRLDLILDGIEPHVHTIDGHLTADYGATERAAIGLLDDASGGLADIHSDIAAISLLVDDLETRLTATRAGYLDNLSAGVVPTAAQNAAAVAGSTVEGTLTYTQSLRVLLSALAGKLSGGGTVNLAFRDTTDAKDRITAVVDANGNRTSITLDVS